MFRVEVEPVNVKQTMLVGLVGAALASALMVTVFDAGVTAPSAGDRRVVPAGQTRLDDTVHAVAGPALKAQVAALEAERTELMAELASARRPAGVSVAAQAADDLRQENRALLKENARLKEALGQEQVLREETEGAPIAFPEDLPAAYREAGLRAAFSEALAGAGIEGEVEAIDCSEFPCIVYGSAGVDGESRAPLDTAFGAFESLLDERWPRETHDQHTSVWGARQATDDGTRQVNRFGMVVYPKAFADGGDPALRKRIRFRQQQYVESLPRR